MSEEHVLELDLELLADVCLSTENRTLGPAGTFTCIPGRTLWGAAANLAYRSGMAEAEAFRLFHQGAVRILDSVPAHDGARSYPLPLAFHGEKEGLAGTLHNFALAEVRERLAGVRTDAVKTGWLSADGTLVEPEEVFTLRTSVDPTGRARDGLLYGLSALRAGTRLWGGLCGRREDVETVATLLTRAPVRLGRSRNAELGLVRVKPRVQPARKLESVAGKTGILSFLLVSRCLLRDPQSGAPRLEPRPEDFGLEPAAWSLDPASSFLRTARVVHFNAKRQRPETQRFALERGSVVTFEGGGPVSPGTLPRWAGEHQGEGYGEVLPAPKWLGEAALQPTSVEPPRSSAPPPGDELFRWADERARGRQEARELHEAAWTAARRLRRFRVPGAQWGELHGMARAARFLGRGGGTLLAEVEQLLQGGRRRLSDRWRDARGPFLEACRGHVEHLPVFLEHLAGACMRPEGEDER